MNLPGPVRLGLERELGPVRSVATVGGGCVSEARRVGLGDGTIFVKFDPSAPGGFFEAEAGCLAALGEAASDLRIPQVLALSADDGGFGWIALEWLTVTAPSADYEERLGMGLAKLHRASSRSWGWERDGFIGTLPQSNRRSEEWPAFWWRERLEPQLRLAASHGVRTGPEWRSLEKSLAELLRPAEADGPSLLHGDLWSGNVLAAADGPALIDPASYFGHREVDLAMLDLFGGYGPRFHDAYNEVWPLTAGYDRRRAIYQLYYLLVHVNLFGTSYLGRTVDTLRMALAAS